MPPRLAPLSLGLLLGWIAGLLPAAPDAWPWRSGLVATAFHAHAAGIASGSTSGTRNRAGPLIPAHHIAYVATASKYGSATTSHSMARRRARVNPAMAISRTGAVANSPNPWSKSSPPRPLGK